MSSEKKAGTIGPVNDTNNSTGYTELRPVELSDKRSVLEVAASPVITISMSIEALERLTEATQTITISLEPDTPEVHRPPNTPEAQPNNSNSSKDKSPRE